MRIHVGNGTIFLRNWINVNIAGPKTFLAKDRPDLVDRWITDESDYFSRHRDKSIESLRQGPLMQEMVCDEYGDFEHLPGGYWTCEELLARNVFEHLSITEAHRALDSVDAVMTAGGILRLDVPDHDATLQLYKETGDPFYVRHLLGPRNGSYGAHMLGYARDGLRALVEEHGFVFVEEEPNIHLYPAFTLKFRKMGLQMPHQYGPPLELCSTWSILEIGPGLHELPQATVYLDHDLGNVNRLKALGKETILADFESGLPHIPDKSFDFVYCSHVMEHLQAIEKAAATLSRIGKGGRIIMPSAAKEALTIWDERSHLWAVWDHPQSGRGPIFIRNSQERLDKLRDIEVMKIMARAFRSGPNYRITDEGRLLRKWWSRSEVHLDVIHDWEGELEVTVVE